MSEKKPRTPRISYEVFDEEALAQRFPELFRMVRELDKPGLYKKVVSAIEMGMDIPGVRIGAAPPSGETPPPPPPPNSALPAGEIHTDFTPAPEPAPLPATSTVCEPIPDPNAKPQLELKQPVDELGEVPAFIKKKFEDDGLPF